MKDLRKVEKILVFLGTFVFCAGLYLFAFQAERVAAWLGMPVQFSQNPVGKVIGKKNMTRRRLFTGNEFNAIDVQQSIFSRDTVMTGANSQTIISLNDGSLLDLGADSLVEIKFRDEDAGFGKWEFLVNVKQGDLKAYSKDGSTLTVIQKNGAPMKLLAFTPTPSPTATPAPMYCKFEPAVVTSPIQAKNLLPRVRTSLICPTGAVANLKEKIVIEVRDTESKVVERQVRSVALDQAIAFEFSASRPGNFSISARGFAEQPLTVSVPEFYEELKWPQEPIKCNRGMIYELPAGYRPSRELVTLLNESRPAKIQEKRWDGIASFDPLKETDLSKSDSYRVVMQLNTGFKLMSGTAIFKEWRHCVELTEPAPRSQHSVRIPILFTWVLNQQGIYHFRLAKDPKFSKVVIEQQTRINFVRKLVSQPGTYYWQVQSSQGDFSAVYPITVK